MQPVGDPHDLVKAGTEFWPVYLDTFSPTSFNPNADGRFAAQLANPPRAMFYAGETVDCALWETVLRDVVPERRPPHGVEVRPVVGYRIARLRIRRAAPVLDLGRLGVRWLAGADLKLRDRITVLTTVPKYTATHKEAARLLTALPQTAGFLWPSKQTDEDGAYVFYQPPTASDDFEVIETIPLDSPMGAQLIDQALARAQMRRFDALALEQELVSQLPPDIDEGDWP